MIKIAYNGYRQWQRIEQNETNNQANWLTI